MTTYPSGNHELLTPGMRIRFVTQGCRVNQSETEALRAWAWACGAVEVGEDTPPHLLFINSCAVTEKAVRDLVRLVRTTKELFPQTRILVAGCAAEAEGPRLQAMGVELLGSAAKRHLVAQGRAGISPVPRRRTRAIVAVQDGCSAACAYCVIPSTRGPSQSRPVADVLAEVEGLCAAGVPEITISAVSARSYQDQGRDFWALVTELDRQLRPRWVGRTRIRLGSLDPGQLGPRALDVLAECALVCPHLHLSIQSGSLQTLRRMGRSHYHPEAIVEFVQGLSRIWPIFGLGADFIAGFPGETADDFQTTLALARALPLTYAHVFPYSERPGTAAATLPGAIPPSVRQDRAHTLRQEIAALQAHSLGAMGGRQVQVVMESPTTGRAETYVVCRLTQPYPPGSLTAGTIAGWDGTTALVQPQTPQHDSSISQAQEDTP